MATKQQPEIAKDGVSNTEVSQNEALKGENRLDDVNDRSEEEIKPRHELSFDTILKELGEEEKAEEAHVKTERVQNYAAVNCIPEEVEKLVEDSSTKDKQTICPEEGLVPNQEENKHMVYGGEIKTQETLNQTIPLSLAGERPVEESLKQGEWDTARLQQETEHFNTERNHEAMDSEEVGTERALKHERDKYMARNDGSSEYLEKQFPPREYEELAREPCAEPANSRKREEDALGTIGSSVATEANEVKNEQLEVVPAERKEEDPIRGIIHKDQEAEINDMLQESENYVTNDGILTRSAIEQTNEVSTVMNEANKETDEAADKFEISSIAKEDHLAAQPAEEVETSKMISSKADGDSKGFTEQETAVGELSKVNNTVSHLENLALRESTEKLREDGELNPTNGTTTDHIKNAVFATTETGTDRSENDVKKPIEEETIEEPKHDATLVQTENDCPAEEETTARHIEEMTREQELHEKDDELLFAATKTDVETTTAISTKIEDENIIGKLSPMIDTNTCPDNLTPTETIETLAQYNVSEGKPVHPEIKIAADCEENKYVALEDTSADNESAKIPSEEDETVEELNEDATPDQTENDCPAEEEKGEMHIEETTREPELQEKAAQLLPKTTKADASYSDEKVETTDFISPKIDEEENVVRKFSSVNDTNTYLDNLASRESPETSKEYKIPEGNPVDAESINKQMPNEVELAEEPLQHATPDKKENDPAEAESGRQHVVETTRELELQEEADELLTGTKKEGHEKELLTEDPGISNTEVSLLASVFAMEDEAGVENQKKHRDNSTIENDQLSHNEALKGENRVDDVNDTGEEKIQPRHELSFDTMKEGEEDKAEAHVKTEREQNYAAVNCIPEEVEKLAEDSSTKDKQTICPEEGLVPNQEENKHMVDGGEIKTQETLNQTTPLSLAGERPVEESLKQGEWKVATEANEVENEQLEVVPVERKEEDPIRGIIHKDQEAEKIDDMLHENENYVTNDGILTRSAIEQTNEVSTVMNEAKKETDEAADKFEISSIAKEDHLAAQPAEEVETSKVISSKADGDSKGFTEQETAVGELSKVNNTVSHLENLALRESTEKLREDGELNLANGTTTDHINNAVFATTETGTDRSENDVKKPIEEETIEEPKHDATLVQTENDCHAEEETAARHIEEMTREQELHEKDDELLFAATKTDVETTTAISTKIEDENIIGKLSPMIDTNTCPDNLTPTETLAQYNVSEGKPVHPEIKITADCEENKDVALEDTSADNESAKIPSENEDATPDQTEKDCPAEEEKGEMHIEETTREPELKENAAQLLPKTTKADVSYSNEKVETTNFISPKIDEEENVVRKFSSVNDTNTHLDNLASRESPETSKEYKIPQGNPVDAESINKQMPIEVELAEEPLQHATPHKKENDPAEAESGRWHVVETSRELELQEETDELLTGTKKMQREDEYVEEQCRDETLEQTEVDCSAEEETRGRHAEGKNRELELSKEADELLSGNTKTDVISLKEDETVEHCRGTTPDQTENGCPAEEDIGESHVEEETRELELQEEADGLQSKVQVETFKDMSPKNYEEENIVQKFSTMNFTTTHVQNLTSAASPETLMEYNDSSEKPSNQDKKNTVDYEKSHDVSMEDMSADTSKHSKLPSEEEIVEEPSQDATLCNKEKYSPAEEEMGTRHVNTATEEFQQETLMRYKFSDENLVKPDKITVVDHEKNDVGVVEDMTADTSENAKLPSKDKVVEGPCRDATPHQIAIDCSAKEETRERQAKENTRELELSQVGDELLRGTTNIDASSLKEEVENSNVISSNADEDSKGSNEQETIVGDLSKVNNIVTHLENLALRESPEQLKEHSELTPANGTTTTHRKTDDFVMTETGADRRENDDKKPREDCSVEDETTGRHIEEITREPELHEKDDELLSGARKTDVETSTAISTKIGEDENITGKLSPTKETNTKLDNPENKTSAGCEKNKDVTLEDMSADQESAKIPSEDENVEEQNKNETPDQTEHDCPAEDEKGEMHSKETTREPELQEEDDELLFKTTKAGVSYADEKMPIEDEAVEEPPQHATLEKTENDPAEGRCVNETTREQESQEEADESLIGTKMTDLGSVYEKVESSKFISPNIGEEENNTGKLSLVNDTNNAGTRENTKIPSEDENIEEQFQDETLEKREFDCSVEEETRERHAKETTRELELQEEADELPMATKTDADVGFSDEKVETFKDMSPKNYEDENIVQKFSLTNDANTNVNDLASAASAETVLEYNISTEKTANQDNKNIADFEKDNNAAMEEMSADTSENTKMPSEEDTVEEPYNAAEIETGTGHVKTATEEFHEKVDELAGTKRTDVGSLNEMVTSKVIFPTFDEEENAPGKLSLVNDTNTYLDSQTSTEAPETLMGHTFSDEKLVKPDKITIVDHEKNTVGVEDMSADTSENAKMSSEGKALQGPYQDATPHQTEIDSSAEEETRRRHDKEKTRELELSEEADELLKGTTNTDVSSLQEQNMQVETSKVLSPKIDEEENIFGKLSPMKDTNTCLYNLPSTESPKNSMEYNVYEGGNPINRDKKNKADHEKNDNAAMEEMSADTSENAKMPCEQDATPGKKETDCPAEEERGTRHVKTTREELHEEADELITTTNRSDVGSLNEKVQASKAVFLKIDEEENVLGNLSLVNDTNTYLDSQTSTIAPITLTGSNVSEGMPIKLDKITIADNEKNIDVGIEDMSSDTSENTKMPSEAQTVEGLSMDATLHQTENDCLTEDETGRRPDKEPTRELVFQEEADDLLLGTTKTDVSSLNEKIETSTTISPKIYEEGNVIGKLSLLNDTNRHVDNLTSQQSPEILMEYDTITIGGQEKNDDANMEDMSADTGDNAKGIDKKIPREDKSVGEPCRDATVDQTGKHGHVEEETNGRHVKETTRRLEIQQEDHDLLTEATKTEASSSKEKIDIFKVMPPKTDEGSKVSIDQENIADECQQARNKSTYKDNLASRESPENSIEYSVFEGQAGSPENKPTSDQEKNNDVALADVNPLSLVESEKPRNPIDEFSCNSTSFTRDSNFEDQEDSTEGDDNHKGEECKRTGKMEDHTVTQLESKEEAFNKENETSSEVDSRQQQNEENAKLPTMTRDTTQYEEAILGRNVQAEKEELQRVSSSKIVPESEEVKHEKDERKPDESKNITEKCLSMESDLISKSSLNETSTEEILQATENRENQNPCEDSPIDTVEHVAQALTKPNDTESQLMVQGPTDGVQQEMETLDSLYAFKAVLGAKGEYHKDDNFINDCNIKTSGLESITCPQSSAQSNKEIPQEQDKEGALDEPESFHVSSDSNELVTSHDAILNASCGNDVKMPLEVQKPKEESLPNYSSSTSTNVLNLHQKVSADISLSEEDNTEQGKIVQEEVISREGKGKTKASVSDNLQVPRKGISVLEEDVKPKSQQISLKEEFEDGKTKSVESEGQKTDQDEETKVESSDDIPVTVEVPSISADKPAQKKSHSILSGVGSKVKHSIAKVKKVITGKHSNQKPAPSI